MTFRSELRPRFLATLREAFFLSRTPSPREVAKNAEIDTPFYLRRQLMMLLVHRVEKSFDIFELLLGFGCNRFQHPLRLLFVMTKLTQ